MSGRSPQISEIESNVTLHQFSGASSPNGYRANYGAMPGAGFRPNAQENGVLNVSLPPTRTP
jgi:hypothetical protein